jgi:hypothetical protein
MNPPIEPTQSTPTTPTTRVGRSSTRPATKYQRHHLNTYIHPELADIARVYFRTTRYRSISGFFEDALRKEFRRRFRELRALKLPNPQPAVTE